MILPGLYEQFTAPLKLVLRWLFGHIHYSAGQAETIAELSQRGTVVFVTRGHSNWLALCFCHVFARMGLPPISYLGGVDLYWHRPGRRLLRALRRRRQPEPTPLPIEGLPNEDTANRHR